ncbi:MAG TPA: hypothetical protein VIK01_22580 [Polyangiaceae bacterium]
MLSIERKDSDNGASSTAGESKRAPFYNAEDVYDYVSARMPLPKSAAGTLKPDDGVPVPAGGVTEANAKSVALR